jgi:hypothetical protein
VARKLTISASAWLVAAGTGMGLAASVLGRSGSGPLSRVASITTSRAKVTAEEAPEKYKLNWLPAANTDKAFNANTATQQSIETALMVGDIFIPLRTKLRRWSEGERYNPAFVTAEAGIPLVAGIQNGETYS